MNELLEAFHGRLLERECIIYSVHAGKLIPGMYNSSHGKLLGEEYSVLAGKLITGHERLSIELYYSLEHK